MQIQTKGIILKQIKIPNDRRLLTIFTEKYGKITVAVNSDSGKGRNKSSLVYKSFTLGNYFMYKNRDDFRMSKGEVVRSYYRIGEDIDRYLEAAYVLEFTEKLLPEGEQATGIFNLLNEYFEIMEKRKREFEFLTVAFLIKAVFISGYMPRMDECACCGNKKEDYMFSITEGGVICSECAKDNGLIYNSDSDIIKQVMFISKSPFSKMENIYMEKMHLERIRTLIKKYSEYHLGISNLKSEHLI